MTQQPQPPGVLVGGWPQAAFAAFMAIAVGVTLVACGGKSDRGSASSTTTTTAASKPSSTTTTPSSQAAGPTARASNGSFTVSVPKGWLQVRNQDLLLQLGTDDGQATFAVGPSEPPERGNTIQESAQIAQKSLTGDSPNVVDPGGIESMTVDGEAAVSFTYTQPSSADDPQSARGRALIVRHRDVEYSVLLFSRTDAFQSADVDFKTIIGSWKWSS